jgi:aminocarboxymuconate-semialdehyde decarboxylase
MSPHNATSGVIDVHTHVIPARLAAAAERSETVHGITFGRDAAGGITSSSGGKPFPLPWPTPLETPEDRIGSMDQRRIDVHLLSLSPTMHWYDLAADHGRALAEETNDDIASLVQAHPSRFRGLAFLPLQDPPAAVRELERCTRQLGFPGAMVGTNVNGLDWDSPELYPVLEAAADLGALLFVHPARGRADSFLPRYHLRNLIGNPLETTVAVASLVFGGILDRLPDLALCFAHGGGYGCLGIGRMDHGSAIRAETSGMSRLPSEYLRQLYFDSLVHSHRALSHLVDLVGADRIVLGSDYPADMGETFPVEFIESHPDLTDEERLLILGGNAARILGSAPAPPGGA